MVSFQCEGCGDVQTKKKLDSHRNQCHAPFTCLDCMVTFQGTQYRSHTSCVTEAEKYEGHLYQGKKKGQTPNNRKSVSILEPTENNAIVPRNAYVEDGDVPPAAPTPPPAVPDKNADSVFDYLVQDEDPDTPRLTYVDKEGEMAMTRHAPSLFTGRSSSRDEYRNAEEQLRSNTYDENGYSYGAEPIAPRPPHMNASTTTLDYMTPAAKATKAKLGMPESASHSRQNSYSEKKRKRAMAEEHNTDTTMPDAPETIVRSVVDHPSIAHSGLTGGLQRMLTNGDDHFRFPVSPDSSPNLDRRDSKLKPVRHPSTSKHQHEEPQSPLKRSRRGREPEPENGLGISIKGRAGRVISMIGGALNTNGVEGAMVKSTRRRGSSSDQVDGSRDRGRDGERRERKKHKVTRHNGTSRDNVRMDHTRRSTRRHDESRSPVAEDVKPRKQKAIEYHKTRESSSDSEDDRNQGQMVVFGAEDKIRQRCDDFLGHITKGPGSEKGYSINKVLKRWHRDNDVRSNTVKHDEEKELWKGLRLKKNDRGEIVVFFS